MPNLIVIAGPNGAGKSTAAEVILGGLLRLDNFVNADTIARGLSRFNPEGAAFQAGRLMLARLQQLADDREDFAFETTLASRTFAPWIAKRREHGYTFHLHYLWVPAAELSIARVATRVKQGGHHVPDDVIRRRYRGGMRNLFELYIPIADEWHVYDNSLQDPRTVAEGIRDTAPTVYDEAVWTNIRLGGTA